MNAIEAYRHALRSTYVSRDADECGRTYGLVDEDAADAAITELEAERDEAIQDTHRLSVQLGRTEAERDAYANAASEVHTERHFRLQAEDMLEELRVCGSCVHCRWQQGHPTECWAEIQPPRFMRMGDRCRFTPSRWTARAVKEEQ